MRAALAAVSIAGLLVRLWGIGFGLPQLYHPDEPAYVLQALAVARGLPNGLTFANPPLFKYLLLAEYAVTFGVERLVGTTHSQQEFIDQFRADPSLLYLIARISSAVFGALTVFAAGILATTVGSRRVGVIAACLTALAYLLVRDAHFGVNDSLVTLLVTLGLIVCVRIQRGASTREYLLAGAVTGLAFAAKYYGVVLLAPLALAHVLRPPNRRCMRELATAAAACVLAALIGFPSLVTEPARVIQDIYQHLYVEAIGGYDGLDPSGGYAFYAKTLATGLGLPLVIAAVAGVGLSVARRDRSSLVVVALPVVMLLVLGSERLYFARFAMPVLPALLVEAALAVDWLLCRNVLLGAAAGLIMVVPTFLDSVRFDALLTRTDTRTLAGEWVRTNVPNGASIAVDSAPLGPTLSNDDGRQVLVANEFSLFDLTPAGYLARGVEYVVVSSFTAEAPAIDPARDARRLAFNSALQNGATLLAQFRPYSGVAEPSFEYDQIYGPWNDLGELVRPGPTISVYRLAR